jgi:5-bromo-4-chloroindolyl phosphate hydrolysis protein
MVLGVIFILDKIYIMWFNNWEWLKDSHHYEYSFTRIIGTFLILIQTVILCYIYSNKELKEIVNIYQTIIIALPSITTVLLFIFQMLKEHKALGIKLGDKEYKLTMRNNNNNKQIETTTKL